jgi:hypothetical protein
MCDCDTPKKDASESLHEKFCRLTHGIPCKAVHAVKALILGQRAAQDGCSGGSDSSCGCGGHATKGDKTGTSGCGCGGHH